MLKYFKIFGLCTTILIGATNCKTVFVGHPSNNNSVNTNKTLPPGQAKKVAGTQSAKPFAPGQQKKKKY